MNNAPEVGTLSTICSFRCVRIAMICRDQAFITPMLILFNANLMRKQNINKVVINHKNVFLISKIDRDRDLLFVDKIR